MDAKDRRIADLEKRVAELEALLKAALAKIAQLEKNSANSLKPPSSDIVKPPKDKDRRRKKKIGAQKGHKQNLRTPFPEDQIDQTIELTLDSCPKCHGKLVPSGKEPKKHQQVELVAKPFIVTEYHQMGAQKNKSVLKKENYKTPIDQKLNALNTPLLERIRSVPAGQ